MNESQFLSKYIDEIPIFRAWGDFVNAEITAALENKLVDTPLKDTFLKIPPAPRIKEQKSIIAKAFWRGKNYTDPYEEITDKVGVRYVVLLLDHIKIMSDIVCANDNWQYSKDKDFEQERISLPFIFDYQSLHYVVRNRSQIIQNGITIPIGTPCEVQIRTLLQHACSELTHDTIYKQETAQNPLVYRSVAKSRALTESADDIFHEVNEILYRESETMNTFLKQLKTLYQEIHQPDFEEKSNIFILDSLIKLTEGIEISDIRHFITEEQPEIKNVISNKFHTMFIYRQPIVLLLYYLIQKQRENLKRQWPLPNADIQPLFADLGVSMDATVM